MDNNAKRFGKIDDRGSCDLERIIDEQKETIQSLLQEVDMLTKQKQFLQNAVNALRIKLNGKKDI